MGSIYREYCNNKSFEERFQKPSSVSKETHIVLAFARDYDEEDRHTNGIYREFFDKNVTPQLIADFKKNFPSDSVVKFFLCIGNCSEKYPFHITDKARWITNATRSLQHIIQHYGFDGIDVYYTRSHINANDSVDAIGKDGLQVLRRAVPHRNCEYFDYVVYQTHDDVHHNIPLNDPQDVITIFNDLVSNHNYPKEKLLVGHSILPKDWDTAPYPVILTALPKLIKDGTIQGTSVWAITDDDQP
ncbi:ruBisCO-associated protein-like [Senna tora]|uniref:RuBisCO-associated protein-like n=1 Tax=Senna tora TaxID=362788 RepID=A0A834W8U0_9FABA|nr:ruBisCO-associated protein-like [Senna tora]